MLFSIVDYNNEDIYDIYDDDNDYNDNMYKNIVKKELEINICFICYEEKIPSLKLKNINCYIKNCDCNIDIHKKCLDEWYNKNSTCPICIKLIYKKTNENTNNENINNSNIKNKKIIIFVKQNINIFLNSFLIFYTLNCFYNLYLSIYKQIYNENMV
jgi:hypothetical protein